jgi:hypothetical protein
MSRQRLSFDERQSTGPRTKQKRPRQHGPIKPAYGRAHLWLDLVKPKVPASSCSTEQHAITSATSSESTASAAKSDDFSIQRYSKQDGKRHCKHMDAG